jgi:hypothetical protein
MIDMEAAAEKNSYSALRAPGQLVELLLFYPDKPESELPAFAPVNAEITGLIAPDISSKTPGLM